MNLLSTEKGYAIYLKLNVLYVGKNAMGNPAKLNSFLLSRFYQTVSELSE